MTMADTPLFRTSIATVCLAGTLEEKMRAAAMAGFDGVEVFEPDLVASPLSPEQVRELADELGLSLDLYQPFRDLEGVGEEQFQVNLRRLEAKCRLMERLGMDLMLVCSNVGTADRWQDAVAADQLGRAADVAARHGVRIAYEALAWGRFVNTYRHAWQIVQAADRPNLGVCLDSFHILSRSDNVAGFADIPSERIFFVQLADAPIMALDVLDWSRHHRNFPGEGGFDLPAFMRALAEAGYDGTVSLEVFSDVYRQTDPVRTAQSAMRSLRWLHQTAGGRTPERPSGWDFAELRTADPDELALTLRHLGFVDRGIHRTKDVRLFSVGDARAVLNDGPVPARGDQGNTLVASLGLQLSDPARAAALARDLEYPHAWRANRADEMVLHGVQAPDGTEVFLSHAPLVGEPAWTGEFGPQGSSAPAPAPSDADGEAGAILGIDHVNLAQPWQWFDEAIAFYRAVLGMEAQTRADVASPQGLVRSQAMRTPDGAVRIPLNLVPQGTHAESVDMAARDGRPRDASALRLRAASPQHIAFRSSDVIAAARTARDRGLRMLPVPANYYEDLAARFDMDPELLADLRRNDVLYDRDDQGEFLHFYTRTAGSVFFEVVERRGGYEGYGAQSAPVRLAAQYDLDRF